ncbi:MAG: DNA-formamidopyrimidine glycosylase [FCB group bacterium]|nr:DNA-formamidopyrimidine glycosylase [FCB group bacterium]
MPELPEVETVVRSIRPHLVGKTISRVSVCNGFSKVFATHSPEIFNRQVAGRYIKHVRRRGKYIVFDLDHGYLLIHLRMTGRLIFRLLPEDNPKHLTAHLDFTDGSELFLKDYRKFGRLYYFPTLDPIDKKLGIEPLSDQFTPLWLFKNLHCRNRFMKPLLLDQGFIAGLGNIYVDEILWQARIHPLTSSKNISRQKVNLLHPAIKSILRESIELRGTTIINFSFGENQRGIFLSKLKVFNRQGLPCPRCGTTIIKIRVAQRGTHICPRCQHRR